VALGLLLTQLLPSGIIDARIPGGWIGFMAFAVFLLVMIPLLAAAVFLGGVLWLVVMRFFLPVEILRRWAFYGPRIPILSSFWEGLAESILGKEL